MYKNLRRLIPLLVMILTLGWTSVVPSAQTPEAAAIRSVLDKQVSDWNRGDIEAFASGYKNSPDILFMGQKISRGYTQMLENYKSRYPNQSAMGILDFSDLEVQPLDDRFATATGRFHLERTPAGGGNANGHFMLVLEKTRDGWKIVRDDTTAEPVSPR